MSIAFAFLKRDFSLSASYRLSFVFQLGGIMLGLATFYFVGQVFGGAVASKLDAYGGDYFAFVLIGLALSSYMGLGLSGFAEKIREGQSMGTLELMLITPTRLSLLLFSSSSWSYVMSSVQVVLYLVLGALLFQADLGKAHILSAVLVLALSIAAFSGIGVLSGAFVLVFKKGDPIAWVVGSVSSLLGGMLYPVSVLPDWLQKLSAMVPLTYSLDAMRLAVLKGYSPGQLLPDLMALAAFAAVLLPLSLWLFGLAIKQAKKEGSLGQY